MGEVKPESRDLRGQHTPANIYCYFFFPEKGGGTKCQARLKNNLHLFSQKRCQQLREESGTGTADPFPPAGPVWQAPNAFLRSSGAGASAPQPRCGQHWSGVKIYAKTTDFTYSVSKWPSPDSGSPLAVTFSRLRIFLLRSSSKLVYCEPAMS